MPEQEQQQEVRRRLRWLDADPGALLKDGKPAWLRITVPVKRGKKFVPLVKDYAVLACIDDSLPDCPVIGWIVQPRNPDCSMAEYYEMDVRDRDPARHSCTCGSWVFNDGRTTVPVCKHILACRSALRAIGLDVYLQPIGG